MFAARRNRKRFEFLRGEPSYTGLSVVPVADTVAPWLGRNSTSRAIANHFNAQLCKLIVPAVLN